MEKYIKLNVDGGGTQTLSLSNVKLIDFTEPAEGEYATEIYYLGGAKASLTHPNDSGQTVREALQNALVALHQKNWREVRDDFTSPLTISNIAVS